MSARILVVEDDQPTRDALCVALEERWQVHPVESGEAAILALDAEAWDAVVCDLRLGEVDGLAVLAHTRVARPEAVFVLVTGHGTVATAVEAVKGGAWDFLTKPVDLDRLELTLERGLRDQRLARENRALRTRLRRRTTDRMVGTSQAMQSLREDIERLAGSDISVLVCGESGVGKELVAEALHEQSSRADGPLVRVNCPALAEGVLESELFGHERGAFTGAVKARQGRFEAARGGTLFLDEIGEISPAVQAKLLRALEQHTIERVGSSRSIRVDVRVVAATNRDLLAAVEEGRFREDLYYRLAVVRLDVPPLRERPEDVPLLVSTFLERFAAKHGRELPKLEARAARALRSWTWPGNVRELRNWVESAVVLSREGQIGCQDLPEAMRACAPEVPVVRIPVGTTLAEAEQQLIEATLRECGGNKAEAARVLGMGLRTLFRRLGG